MQGLEVKIYKYYESKSSKLLKSIILLVYFTRLDVFWLVPGKLFFNDTFVKGSFRNFTNFFPFLFLANHFENFIMISEKWKFFSYLAYLSFEKSERSGPLNSLLTGRRVFRSFNYTTVKPVITNTSKEFIKCRILHFLIMECCRYLVF